MVPVVPAFPVMVPGRHPKRCVQARHSAVCCECRGLSAFTADHYLQPTDLRDKINKEKNPNQASKQNPGSLKNICDYNE